MTYSGDNTFAKMRHNFEKHGGGESRVVHIAASKCDSSSFSSAAKRFGGD